MTSVTYGMLKSLSKVTFDMHQGALASFLNVFDMSEFEDMKKYVTMRICLKVKLKLYSVEIYLVNTMFGDWFLSPSSGGTCSFGSYR
jgi:hypothetical protein